MSRSPDRLDWLLFLLLAAIWGSSFLFIKIAIAYVGPFELVSLRLLFGTTVLAAVVWLAREPLPRDRRTIGHLLVLAVFNVVVPFSLISWGERTIPSGVASILNATMPLFTIVVATIAIGEQISRNRLVGLAFGFAGVVVVVSRSLAGGNVAGELAVAAAACCYAAATVYARHHVSALRPMVSAIGQVGLACPIVAALAIAFEHPWTVALPWQPLIATIWLGALGSAVAYLIYFRLLAHWDATRMSLVTYLQPVVGVVLGAAVLGEVIDWRVAAGAALVVGGVALVNVPRLRRRRGPAAAGPERVALPQGAVPERVPLDGER